MTRLIPILLLLRGPADVAVDLKPVGRLEHPGIRECSGVVASRRFPGVFWVHNDSGNPPRLFAVRGDGTLIREYHVGVPNIDWEDIAADDRGHLYLGDIGNNDLALPIRAVHRLDEPDPFARRGDQMGVLKVQSTCYYRFAPGGRFDAEGLVVRPDGRSAWIVAKSFDGREAEVYELPMEPPSPLLRPAVPTRLGVLPGFTSPATGADLHENGLLAVVSKSEAGVYSRRGRGEWRRVGGVRHRGGGDVEAVAWDGSDLLLTSESRGVFRIKERLWRGTDGAR